MKDLISGQRVQLLHPLVRTRFQNFIEECENELNIVLRITQGFRSFAEQDAIYQQGRTKPGKIVTMAKPGCSYHNYGLAIDLCELIEGNEVNWYYDMSKLLLIANKYNFEWGGNWVHIKDYPHFQYTFGYTIEQLLERYNNNQISNGYIVI